MRFSEIAAVYFHALNKMLVSGTHTQWKLIDLQSDLFTVVFDSIVHELKHNKIVMFAQCIDSVIPGCVDNIYLSGHTLHIVAKSTIGSEAPELSTAIYDAPASFLSSALTHARIMVGWAGEPKGSPVSVDAGSLNPVQSATSEIETSGGGSFPQSTEAAIMATVPAITRLNDEDLHKLSYITTALRALRKVTLSDPQAHQVLVETILNLQAERIRLADKANFHIHRLLNISGGHRHA
ncbi:ash family protein [Escherichia coli]|uniref:ash family protein n=1 Tax=Escherichia coli TaxID=562 RepID=UPI00201AF3D1|nr:ash family protein [Escherichia coli]